MLKKIITIILIWEAKVVLSRWKPKIIGITGSVGKSSSKELISCVLEKRFTVRKNPKSYNSEIGVALSILGFESGRKNIFIWIKNIVLGFFQIFSRKFPNILILEMGIDRPKDMDKLLRIVRPNIAVFTAVGEIPVHVEFFSGPNELAEEKGKIFKYLKSEDYAILNFDDLAVFDFKDKIRTNVLSFGFGDGADFRASNYKVNQQGSTFKVDYEGSSVPVRLDGVFGKHNVYAILSAFVAGEIMGMKLIEISEYVSLCNFLPGRLKMLNGIKNSKILDDTYNSSPASLHAALDTMRDLESARKIAILGDMLEIGKYTIEAHKMMGQKSKDIVDILVTVGMRAKFASDEALSLGMEKKNIFHFSTSKEASAHVKDLIKEGDLILVKGSQAMRMEKIVEEIIANPEDKKVFLVRQDKIWTKKF